MTRYTQQPEHIVAPWFAYTVGCLIALASITFIVETIRVEIAIRDTTEAIDSAAKSAADGFKKRYGSSQTK